MNHALVQHWCKFGAVLVELRDGDGDKYTEAESLLLVNILCSEYLLLAEDVYFMMSWDFVKHGWQKKRLDQVHALGLALVRLARRYSPSTVSSLPFNLKIFEKS
jgi:hypothetical protein